MRIVFFGTPEFAVPSLDRLLESGFEVPLVVTRPDRPAGRSARPQPSPVARLAAARGLAVEKPERLRENTAFFERLKRISPHAGVVVAYGRLLPRELLELPPLGCVNVHASLLPRYRGASPVQAALLAGDRETGVVTMRIEEALDSGPIYLERRVAIGPREDTATLSSRLAREGADLLVETFLGLAAGSLVAHPQVGEPSFCRPITREDGEIDWTRPAPELERRLRAFTPWPGLHTFLDGERVKLLEAEVGPATGREPGTLWRAGDRTLAAAGEGSSLALVRLQRAGRDAVSGAEFLRGLRELPARFDPGPKGPS